MLGYFIYAVQVIIVTIFIVIFIKKRKVIPIVISALPTIMSLFSFWQLLKYNVFSSTQCLESEGCMNETGMFLVFAWLFMVLSIILLALSFLVYSMIEKSKTQSY